MFAAKAPRLCKLCSCRTIELNQFGRERKGVKNNKSFQKTDVGFTCSQCSGLVCVDCMNQLIPIMKKDSKHFKSQCLLNGFNDAIHSLTNKKMPLSEHIGHCCILSAQKLPTQSEPLSSQKVGCLSGCIFFPEFEIFIDSPLECMDIHALGQENSVSSTCLKRKQSGNASVKNKTILLDARWHCVVPPEVALSVHDSSPKPNDSEPHHWNVTFLHNIKVSLPHNNNEFMYINIRVIHIAKQKEIDISRKASNVPTAQELRDGYLFKDSGPYKNIPDVTLIIGSDGPGSYASILLCRFHNLSPNLTVDKKDLVFRTAWDSLKKSKFECRRSGGSSGLTSTGPVIKSFISTPGTSPRCGKGAVWVQGRDTWFVYYIGTYDGKVKRVKYTNPVPGGPFRFKDCFVETNSFLMDFISIKPITARLIEAIQPKILNHSKFKVWITPQAVSNELMNITKTQTVIACSRNGDGDSMPPGLKKVPRQLLGKKKKTIFYSIYNRDHVNYTLVCHPVGLHTDQFQDDKPTLENKVCFELPVEIIPKEIVRRLYPNGRGGGSSSSSFVFGILDW